jgi:2-isopropylmalate synthase
MRHLHVSFALSSSTALPALNTEYFAARSPSFLYRKGVVVPSTARSHSCVVWPTATATVSSQAVRGEMERTAASRVVHIYDTTLRDGAQGEGISFSGSDKLAIAARLDAFGVSYVEGGCPTSNAKDAAFFEDCRRLEMKSAKVVAFGFTRHKNATCETDKGIQALKDCGAPVVTLVAKAWDMQVQVVLETTLKENLSMIRDSVAYFKQLDFAREVMIDFEHFFDGYKSNKSYAMKTLQAAAEAGSDCLVLCDTNGGCLPWEVHDITADVVATFPGLRVGIHCHNDLELACANSLSAVRAGASLVQGCQNGLGERTGNASLTSIIPSLQLKMNMSCVGDALAELTSLSRYIDEISNQAPVASRPFTGTSAFARTSFAR